MGNDGVFAVDNGGVISSLVEHTHIHAEDVGEVNGASHSSLVRADDHQVFVVDPEIRNGLGQRFQELVGRHEGVEALKRDGVLDSGVVSVEGDDVGNAHPGQFLQSQGTVERFPFAALVLASLIEKGHDHIDTARFSVCCGNDTLQILIVVVRRHMVFVTADRVSQAVVQHIGKDKKIHASYGLFQDSFGFAGTETRAAAVDQVGILQIASVSDGIFGVTGIFVTEIAQVFVHQIREIAASLQRSQL